MAEKRVYLIGGIVGLSYEQANGWRVRIKDTLENIDSRIKVFNPMDHFSFEDVENGDISERQVMEIDLMKLRKSDFAFMNFNAPKSLGSQSELAIAYDRRIPVLGLNLDRINLHPWQNEMIHKMFYTIEDAVDYSIQHLIFED